jgi:hypothetical protein
LNLDYFGNFEENEILKRIITQKNDDNFSGNKKIFLGQIRERDAVSYKEDENNFKSVNSNNNGVNVNLFPSNNVIKPRGKHKKERSPKKVGRKHSSSDKLNNIIRNELEMPQLEENLPECDNINQNITNLKDNKTAENATSILSGVNNNFNDEAFDKIIKEFLNINDFPEEAKEKVCLLKKFISIYKKIKEDKMKLNNFLKKISEKLKEPHEEIRVCIYNKFLKYILGNV